MVTLTFSQILETFAIISTVCGIFTGILKFLLRRHKKEILGEIFHENDRIVSEMNYIQCFLEQNYPGFQRPYFSGVWRSIFEQSCENQGNENKYR